MTGRVKAVDEKLMITSAQPEDSGNYSCIATNMAGSKTASIKIMVSGKLAILFYAFAWWAHMHHFLSVCRLSVCP